MQDKGLDPYIWMLLWPGIFLFAVDLYIFSSHYGNTTTMPFPKEIGKQFSLLVLQMFGLAALVCTLCAYKRVCDGFRLRSSLASLEQETNAQRTYVEQARMRYGQTRAFRHDIKDVYKRQLLHWVCFLMLHPSQCRSYTLYLQSRP